ncbi:MAG TPA: pseudouridine synthase [Actinomycetales bacterium]|nr:pseudouridine synthase [Actinomycetales bacterium]
MPNSRTRARPLPLREGVDPVRIRLADPGQGPRSIPEELRRRFPDRRAELDAALAAGEVVTADGTPVTETTRRHRGMDVWTYRAPEPEIPVPFGIDLLYRDDRLVVVDKPHHLATTPRAGHVTETALVRLRRDLGLDDLAPAHRLDRLTAGVLLFTVDPAHRAAYQDLFAARRVRKTYLAVAPAPEGTPEVRERYSRIVKTRGVLQATEGDGEPDAHSVIRLLATRPDPRPGHEGERLGLYRLEPTTGRTHQLRLHMSVLGTPILGDDLYPEVRTVAPGDFSEPLQLLAESIAFLDPVDGEERTFHTRRRLDHWPDPVPDPLPDPGE